MNAKSNWLFNLYIFIFLLYMLLPLAVMGGAALNDSAFPSVYPWAGLTGRWFIELFQDKRMWEAFRNTILVAIAVVIISVPIGTAAAILINSLAGKTRTVLYALMVAPILTPGAVIGISTLLFWNEFGVSAGLHLSALGQASYISAFVMLMVLARLQSFDRGLEEAALDLGANYSQVVRRILLPHLYPALGAGAAIAFFQSIENFNTTLFTRGTYDTLTVYVFSKVRSGITPTINALALILIVVTLVIMLYVEFARRRKEKALAARAGTKEQVAKAEAAGRDQPQAAFPPTQ
ncbi:MAG: ABC transporter permease [Aestuariivirga sp.]|uniref:ABC transporter permease n=1 Tax=Aestuariivirga sp. TaxID=2650926 RepID=UPI0025BDA11B|nr:ABC transporter permease [Aestuariivirga sp.]MCA3559840.1 ABC transporter permease [Aestuariivirga sp.]